MDTEPPQGDELQRMLVPMKRYVLEHATPRGSRRGRTTGIALGLVGVLLLGATGGGVALGLIPTSFTQRVQAPAPSDTPEQLPSGTPSGAPVSDDPTPVLTPTSVPTPTPTSTSTSTRAPYSLSDPSTWTISGTEVGPVALGGSYTAETDDLAGVLQPDESCLNPDVTFWSGRGTTLTIVRADDGTIASVAIGGADGTGTGTEVATSPTTAAGLGIGSSLAALRAAYPDLHFVSPTSATPDPAVEDPYGGWSTTIDGVAVTFAMDAPGHGPVDSIWVSRASDTPPTEFCG